MPDFSDTRIQFRRGTASEWVAANPVLGSGEPGYDTTNKIFKIGDGTANWGSLSGISGGIASQTAGITGASGVTNIVSMTSGAYAALGSYNPSTMYFIV
jgi:hypothetical protein